MLGLTVKFVLAIASGVCGWVFGFKSALSSGYRAVMVVTMIS